MMVKLINIIRKARDENLKIYEKLFEENKTSPLLKTQEKDFQTRHDIYSTWNSLHFHFTIIRIHYSRGLVSACYTT